MKQNRMLRLLLCVMLLIAVLSTNVLAIEDTSHAMEKDEKTDLQSNDAMESILQRTESQSICENQNDVLVEEAVINEPITIVTDYSSSEIVSAITTDGDFIIEGILIDGESKYDINQYYDFSIMSKYQITDWAYDSNLINEKEKIACYCDLIIQRDFDNTCCLESVIDAIWQYSIDNEISNDLSEKINQIFVNSSDNSIVVEENTRSISNKKTYSSENFRIHYYESNETNESAAKAVADYFEEVRLFYINLGFITPKLQLLNSRYQVYLDPAPDPNGTAAASTFKTGITSLSNTCASYITIYNFTTFTSGVQELIAHEYFHAIQNAYNHQSGWFKEACATWGAIIKTGHSDFFDDSIRSFVSGNGSMTTTDGYGEAVFPLTIYSQLGGSNTIVSIYEEYNNYNATIDESTLRQIISAGIGTDYGFENAYRMMATSFVDTQYWYGSFSSGVTMWRNAPNLDIVLTNSLPTSVTNETKTVSDSLAYLTSNYYELNLPSGFEGAVKIEVVYSNTSGRTQVYTKNISGFYSVNYNITDSSGNTIYVQPNVGNNITAIGIVLSNVGDSSSVSYTVTITLLPAEQMMSFGLTNTKRYMERETYIESGEYVEFRMTSAISGNLVIQTFGECDTILELYSSSGNLLLEGDDTDDNGYDLNSLFSYNFSANTEYIIRIRLYADQPDSLTKLAIIPTFSHESYYDIYDLYDYSQRGVTWTLSQNSVKIMTFDYSTADEYTFSVTSDIDSYLYIIDPRSTEPITSANTSTIGEDNLFNDDYDGRNAQITKWFDEYVPYLVIISAYNPSANTSVGEFYLYIE